MITIDNEKYDGVELLCGVSEPVSGNYEGHDYCNQYLTTVIPRKDGSLFFKAHKVKKALLDALNLELKLYKPIIVYYDDKKRVIDIRI